MEIYKLPESLAVNPKVNQKIPGQLMLSFANGLLHACSYRPFGLNSLWSLIGAVASIGEQFLFEIKTQNDQPGLLGAFVEKRFYLFDIQNQAVRLATSEKIAMDGASRVAVEDERHSTTYWLLDTASLSFEQIITLGNRLLLSEGNTTFTYVSQQYSNWVDDKYVT